MTDTRLQTSVDELIDLIADLNAALDELKPAQELLDLRIKLAREQLRDTLIEQNVKTLEHERATITVRTTRKRTVAESKFAALFKKLAEPFGPASMSAEALREIDDRVYPRKYDPKVALDVVSSINDIAPALKAGEIIEESTSQALVLTWKGKGDAS